MSVKSGKKLTEGVIAWKDMLELIPAKNEAAGLIASDKKETKISVQKRKPRFLVPPFSWIIRPRMKKIVQLDSLGTEIWNMCDNKKNVENIIDIFSEKYNLSFHESRAAVTGYIKMLVQHGILVMIKYNKSPE